MRAVILGLWLALWALVPVGQAQNLPNHFDLRSLVSPPNLAAVPALRFLTTADFAPFNYRDADGQLVGFNIDLARAICSQLDLRCTIQSWPWEQAADALADHQGDALIAGLAIANETARDFDFTSIYLALPARFVAPDALTARFDFADIAGRLVAVRSGTAHAAFAREFFPAANLIALDSEIAALDAVAAGTADFYFGDAMRASFWLARHAACCAFAGPAIFRPDHFGHGLAIAVPAGQDAARAALNWGLRRLKENGRLDELYLRWFPVSFY